MKSQAINVRSVDESPFLRTFPVSMLFMTLMMLRNNVNAVAKKSALARKYLNNLISFRQRSKSFAISVPNMLVSVVKVLTVMVPQLLLQGCLNRLSPNALELRG